MPNLYITDKNNIDDGVYCVDGNVQISNDIGSPGNPADVTFLATGSFEINGNPYMTTAHSDSILIIAEGDVKLNGNPVGGADNFEGLVYAGAQCEVSGAPSIFGQLICKDNPNPPGSEPWVAENVISGDMTLRYMCGGPLAQFPATPLAERMWSHVW